MVGAFSLGVDGALYDDVFISEACWFAREKWAVLYQIETLDAPLSFGNPKEPYKHFLEPWTRTLDLTKTEEILLSEMREKWRYNIRLAEKRWVTTEWVSPTKASIDIWMDLLSETTSRDGFSQNSRSYYEIFLKVLASQGAWGLLFASLEGKVIAAGIFVYSGDTAIYYYGASSSVQSDRKNMAPYLLQWEAIREGKRRWCQKYDFLGIASPDEKSSPLRGVTEFKEKFGGEIVKLGPKYLFPLSWKYRAFLFARKIKNIFRG